MYKLTECSRLEKTLKWHINGHTEKNYISSQQLPAAPGWDDEVGPRNLRGLKLKVFTALVDVITVSADMEVWERKLL